MTALTGAAPRRILVANHWHDDNRGDSAITQGILGLLSSTYPAAQLTVTTLAEDGPLFHGAGRHLTAAYPELTVRASPFPTELRGRTGRRSKLTTAVDAGRWWARLAPEFAALLRGRPMTVWAPLVADHDLVVLVGGSNIFDDSGVPAALSLPRLFGVLSPASAAVRLGKPVVLLGHTLGPFARPLGHRLARRMLAGVALVVVREAGSVAVAEGLGGAAVEEAPDLAFALEPSHTPRVARMLAALPAAADRTLMMSVRQHPTRGTSVDDRLVREFAAAARQLVQSGDVEAVAVVAHTTGPTPIEDDLPLTVRLVEELADLPVALIAEDAAPSELSAFYGSAAAVVAVRLHAAILAINAGTPTFAVSYLTAKTQGVMTQVGLPDAVADSTTVTSAQIVDGVRDQLRDQDLRARLLALAGVRRAALKGRAAHWFHGASADIATTPAALTGPAGLDDPTPATVQS